MIEIKPNENDDLDFIRLIEKALNSSIQSCQPDEIYVIKVDNWFNFKWKSFSGKSLGALGVWNKELRIPPFVPDRIISEEYLKRVEQKFVNEEFRALHIYQRSNANFSRKLKFFSNSAIYLWFSGNTKNSLRGSVMLYRIVNESESSWYISFEKKESWNVNKTKDISRNEFLALI